MEICRPAKIYDVGFASGTLTPDTWIVFHWKGSFSYEYILAKIGNTLNLCTYFMNMSTYVHI